MAGNSIKINPDVNTVSIQPDINKITIVNPEGCSVNVSQPVTNVVRVAGQGLQGPPGPAGPAGPSGSFDTGSLVTTGSFNSFTSSIQLEVDTLTSATSSYVSNSQTGSFTTTSSFNTFTSSIQSEVDNLTSATSSYVSNSQTGSFNTTSSFNSFSSSINTFTSSIQSEVDGLTSVTSSYVSNSQTGSFTTTSSFNSFTGSYNSGSFSGSFQGDGSGLTGVGTDISGLVTTSSFNSFTSSINTFTSSIQLEVDSLTSSTSSYVSNSQTGSFATTGSNTFIGNQIISGSVNITSSLTASGLIYPLVDGTDGQAIITDGAGNLSFATSTTEKLHLQVRNDNGIDIPAGTPIYSTGEIGGSERINVRAASGSDASKMPAIGITETTLTTTGGTKDGFAIINGIYNVNVTPKSGTPTLGDNIYVHADGGLTTIKPTGSALIQNIGTVLKTNGTVIQGMKVSSIDRTNDVPNLLENQIFFGSGSNQSQQIHISGALDQTVINNITASGNISSSGDISAITGSFDYITGQVSTITWTVDFTDGELNTTLYAPYNLAINSVTNIYNSPTTAISSSGSPYTLGNAITTGEPIDITVSTGSVINLNITR